LERIPLDLSGPRGHFGLEERFRIQAERRNRPSKIVADLEKELNLSGNPLSNTGPLFTESLVNSIVRHKQSVKEGKIPTFFMDTITCPLYRLETTKQEDSEFAGIQDIYGNLEEAPRYREKFLRYLIVFTKVKDYLIKKEIAVRGRVYFGDAGIIHAKEIKNKYGLKNDDELRALLAKTDDEYSQCLEKHKVQLGLDSKDISFSKLSDVVPELLEIPLDLGEAADQLRVIVNGIVDTVALKERGVSLDIVRTVHHEMQEVRKRTGQNSIGEKASYREIVGFLLTYGLVGRAFTKKDIKPDIFISLDKPADGQTPENYRHSMYFAFLPKKGSQLPVFIPKSLQSMQLEGISI